LAIGDSDHDHKSSHGVPERTVERSKGSVKCHGSAQCINHAKFHADI
jgi:hypothetical protein